MCETHNLRSSNLAQSHNPTSGIRNKEKEEKELIQKKAGEEEKTDADSHLDPRPRLGALFNVITAESHQVTAPMPHYNVANRRFEGREGTKLRDAKVVYEANGIRITIDTHADSHSDRQATPKSTNTNQLSPDALAYHSIYAQRFWHCYLGVRAFALWGMLLTFSRQERPPTISLLSDLYGYGDRYTLLGRASRGAKAAQKGIITDLEEAGLVTTIRLGEGQRTSYRFNVVETVPLLTPEQVATLPERAQQHHYGFVRKHFGKALASQYPRGLNTTVSLSPAARQQILERDNFTCAYCGAEAEVVDHVFPACRGGSNDPANLVATCRNCNTRKHDRTPEEADMPLLWSPS
jgi:hypothetical protein